jgi:subtilisin-like proprotein convertase family protein
MSDVVSNSWGFSGYGTDSYDNPDLAGWFAQLQSAVQNGRFGLGCVVVFAGGNDRSGANDVGLHDITDDPRAIAVAGVEAGGAVSTFSTPGAGLLVAAVATNVVTPFPGGRAVEISGTSYAAPEVSGIVALMLQANPNLGWRDVQEILADSANIPPNPTSADGALPAAGGVTNGATDWNGGGRQFSNDIGFGVVDADTAVQLARSWTQQSTTAKLVIASASRTADLPVSGKRAVTSPLAFAGNLRIQHVQVTINAPSLPLADLRLVLVSPDGTQSVLLDNAGLVGGKDQTGGLTLDNTTITSNAFWGENARGTWTLQLQDTIGRDVGTLSNWTLQVWGDDVAASSAPLVYTPDFAQLAAGDPARTVVSGAGNYGATTIDVVGQMTAPTMLSRIPLVDQRLAP